jgi:hypothetical protein
MKLGHGKLYTLLGIIALTLVASLTFVAPHTAAQNTRESASGHGTLLVTDPNGKQVRRQFSFNAQRKADGTVTGQAVVHNPAFITPEGRYRSNIQISCMKVVGNQAFLGGSVRRTNDQGLEEGGFDAAFFIVQDNGEPGKDKDAISYVFFDNAVGPEACTGIQPGDFGPLNPIESGNIQVRQ